jgi:hypothetical protein
MILTLDEFAALVDSPTNGDNVWPEKRVLEYIRPAEFGKACGLGVKDE